jgi:hypothetical protein
MRGELTADLVVERRKLGSRAVARRPEALGGAKHDR